MTSQDKIIIDEISSSSSCSSESTRYASSSPSPSSESIQYPTSSSISIKPTVRKTKSNKQKPMLTIDGYHFLFRTYNPKRTAKYWYCANRKCGVTLHTTLSDEFIRFGGSMTDHSHLPNADELEIRNLREVMRQRAENESIPSEEIARQEVRKCSLPAEALVVLPNVANIGMILIFSNDINPLVYFLCFGSSQVVV